MSGVPLTHDRLRRILTETVASIDGSHQFRDARDLFARVALAGDFVEFLTVPGYEVID